MANILTWQNVAAPDFNAAVIGTSRAGALFSAAADQISGALTGAAERGREKASNAAMAKAMQIRDVNEWDQLLATKGLAGLGINPDQATPEMMQFLQGYREDLASDRSDDLNNKTDQQSLAQAELNYRQDGQLFDHDMSKSIYAQDRTEISDNRGDITYDRGEQTYQRDLEAQKLVQELVRGQEITSPQEAQVELNKMALDPETRRLAEAQLERLGEIPFTVAPDVAGSGAGLPAYKDIARDIDRDERVATAEYNKNRPLQLYARATEIQSTFGDTLEPVREKLKEMADGEGKGWVWDGYRESGEVQNVFLDFQKEYPNVSEDVIAAAMEASMRGTGWDWFKDDQIQFNKPAVRDLLDGFNEKGGQELLDSELQAFQEAKESRTNIKAAVDRLAMEYDLHMTYGRKEQAERTRAKLEALVQAGKTLPKTKD